MRILLQCSMALWCAVAAAEPGQPVDPQPAVAQVADPYAADPAQPPTPLRGSSLAAPSGNDFRLKVLFKLDVNYTYEDASLSGNAPLALLKTKGLPQAGDGQAAALGAQADLLSSEHVLGTEGLGWSHLRLYYNGFLLNRFEGFGGTPSAVFPTAYLKGDQQFAYDVRAGYAEINGFKDSGFWSKVYVRAGRQWRYGAGVATFDGGTVGYAGPGVELALWGGRRSPRFYDDTDPGFVAGADAALHLDALTRVPVDIAANYLVYAARPTDRDDYAVHHLLQISARWRMHSGGRLQLQVSSYEFQGLRAYLGFSHPLGRMAQLKLYYDLKLGRDAVYDYVSGFGMAPSRYFTLPDVAGRSRFGLRFDHSVGKHFEYGIFGNFNLVHADGTDLSGSAGGWTGLTAFDATYEEIGAVVRVYGPLGLEPEAEYRIRFVQRDTEKGAFSDTSQSGEHQFKEVRGSVRLRPARGLSFSVGAVYRIYDYVTRYAPIGSDTTVANDTTVAGEATAEVVIKRVFSIRGRYEIGQDSSAFAPELGLVQTVFASLGGRF